jgi:hypothetical protein
MKKTIFILLLGLVFLAGCVIYVPQDEGYPRRGGEYYEAPNPSNMDTSYFYDYLSPYGVWVYRSPYGYVWIPDRMAYNWRPYSYGQWLWSDYGWTWVSHFEWGWAPFHYGRWDWDRRLGWFWVPDTVWGPAWVTWRRGDFYIGWAPLPPQARFIRGVGIRSLPFSLGDSIWIFVEYRYFLRPGLDRYVLPMERNLTIINYTVVYTDIVVQNDRIVNRGIDVDYIGRATRQVISKHQLRSVSRPAQTRVSRDSIEIFDPSIRKNEMAKPKTVVEEKEVPNRITRSSIRESGESTAEQEKKLEEVHRGEIKTLEESQKRQLDELNKEKREEAQAAKTQVEKEKIEKEYNQKITKIKKSQEEEKAQIKERHKKEEDQAAKNKVKKKEIKKKEIKK